MRVTLRQLSVFDAVARHGSVSEAAREVNLSQSAASLALQDLERALGTALFHRHKRRLALNENGRRLQPRAHSMLRLSREIEVDDTTAETSGVLRIAATPTIGNYVLPTVCARFQAEYPNVQLRITVVEEPEVIDRVDEINQDVGFIEVSTMRPMLEVEPWLRDELIVVARPDHWACGKSVGLARLKQERWCLQPIGTSSRHQVTYMFTSLLGAAPVVLESNSVETLKHAAAAGVGIACLSRYAVAEDLAQGRLAAIGTRGFKLSRHFSIISRRDVYHGGLQAAFTNFVRTSGQAL